MVSIKADPTASVGGLRMGRLGALAVPEVNRPRAEFVKVDESIGC